ncbi:MAG: tetratricopeptide repeat protein [Sulfuricellaceae bacterium]
MTANVQTVSLDIALQQALAHHQAGRLYEAEQLYRAILQVLPDQPDANHNLGVLAGQVGQDAAGLPYLKTALEINPAQEQYALSYAGALLAGGQAGKAREVLQAAMQRGIDTPATQALRQNIEAALLHETTQQDKAPTPAEMKRLIALFNAGLYEELENQARLLLGRYSDSGFAWKALGASLLAQGKDALTVLLKASELLPNDAEVHNNVGYALKDCGQFDGAMASYRRALAIKYDFAEAHNNLGNVLQECGQLDGAVASVRQALEIKPDYADAHSNLGSALQDLGQCDAALASYRRALEIKPEYAYARSNLLFACNLLVDHSSDAMLAEARRFGELVARQARPHASWRNTPDPARRLRVGLVSADLRNHPVGYFLENLLAHIAPARLELIAYPSNRFEDELTARIKTRFSAWKPLTGLGNEAAANSIHADGIDILIDLSGHTANNRLPLFAWKPAPVQASWLGYFATTGVAAIDYFIADPWTAPETEETHFTETIRRLPETYLCFTPPDADAPIAPLPALANGHITFGCFNNLTKMNDTVVALWARVLLATPGSRLFLKTKQLGEASVRQRTLARFAAHGIDADRLILEGAAPRAELLASYRRVDIALDPFPYPGGATSAESLWMGVPLLTLAGRRFLSHIGESILQNAGLPEWIATDADDYVARAALHAGDVQRLATLRDGLRQQVLASPLFDAPRFAHHFETALRGMWREWCGSRMA